MGRGDLVSGASVLPSLAILAADSLSFLQMDSGRPWGDAHALDLSFSELVEISSDLWIDPTLVRFRSKLGTRVLKGSSARSVKLLESLSADYAVSPPSRLLLAHVL